MFGSKLRSLDVNLNVPKARARLSNARSPTDRFWPPSEIAVSALLPQVSQMPRF